MGSRCLIAKKRVMMSGYFGDGKIFKLYDVDSFSSFRIVSMIPGDLVVAGCFDFCEGGRGFGNG